MLRSNFDSLGKRSSKISKKPDGSLKEPPFVTITNSPTLLDYSLQFYSSRVLPEFSSANTRGSSCLSTAVFRAHYFVSTNLAICDFSDGRGAGFKNVVSGNR
jgi:hypothetical protein